MCIGKIYRVEAPNSVPPLTLFPVSFRILFVSFHRRKIHIWIKNHQGSIVAYWTHFNTRIITVLRLSKALSIVDNTLFTIYLGYEKK